jgi:hypothetical protein
MHFFNPDFSCLLRVNVIVEKFGVIGRNGHWLTEGKSGDELRSALRAMRSFSREKG